MSKCTNCIFFEVYKERNTKGEIQLHCKRTSGLYSQQELDDGRMGDICRLWDAYIPKESTPEQIEYATKWQDMPYGEQPDYEEYFNM